MQGNATNNQQWPTFALVGMGLGAGLAASVNWLGLAAVRVGSWQVLALASAALLAVAVISGLGTHRRLNAEARLQQVFDQLAEREIARQDRRRKEWWARNLSPALALARVEQQRRYRIAGH